MNNKHLKLFALAIATACALFVCSCDKDKKDIDEPNASENPGQNDNPDNPQVSEVLTPNQVFTYIRDTASEAISKFNPEDQKELLSVAKGFLELYGDMYMPEEFGEDALLRSPAEVMTAIANSARHNSPMGLTRAYYQYSINDVAGIYEPNSSQTRWVRTGDSSSVIFRATVNGKVVQISATPSDGDWLLEADEDIRIPKTLTTTVDYGNAKLLTAVTKTFLDLEAGTANFETTATVANFTAFVNTKGTNSRITETGYLKTGSETILNSQITVNGTGLCNPNYWEIVDGIEEMVSDGTMSYSCIDRVFLDAKVSNLTTLLEMMDTYYESYDGISEQEAENRITLACSAINRDLTAEVKFAGNSSVQATLFWMPYKETWGTYSWGIWPEPGIKYAYDGSTELFYDVDFDFSIVESQLNSLLRRYENFWRSLR